MLQEIQSATDKVLVWSDEKTSSFSQWSSPRMTGFMQVVHSTYLKAAELISVVRNQLESWWGLLLRLKAQSLLWSSFSRV